MSATISDERGAAMTAAAERALDVFRAHGLSHDEALHVIARLAGIFEAGVLRSDERIDEDEMHEEFSARVATERRAFFKMLEERVPRIPRVPQ